MRRLVLPLALVAGLALAGSASAVVQPSCADVTLDSSILLTGPGQPVTFTGAATCTIGSAAPEPAQLTLNGTADVDSCFASPYITIAGTLTERTADAVRTTGVTLSLAPDAGTSTGLGTLTLPGGIPNPLAISYGDPKHNALIGLIERCGGEDEFTIHAQGAAIVEE